MSMTTLVILRFAGIFAAYTGLTVLLPAIMFRRILVGRGLSEQFLMCYTFGNFLYYKYCVCSPAFAYFRFLGTCIVYCCTRDSDLEQGEQGFSKRTLHKDRNYL